MQDFHTFIEQDLAQLVWARFIDIMKICVALKYISNKSSKERKMNPENIYKMVKDLERKIDTLGIYIDENNDFTELQISNIEHYLRSIKSNVEDQLIELRQKRFR